MITAQMSLVICRLEWTRMPKRYCTVPRFPVGLVHTEELEQRLRNLSRV